MALRILKRHTKACQEKYPNVPQDDWKGAVRKCKCPISAIGTLRVEGAIKKSTGTSKWEDAEQIKNAWERTGTTAQVALGANYQTVELIPLDVAIGEFEEGVLVARGLEPPTVYKYRLMMRGLREYAIGAGLRYVQEFDLGRLQKHQAQWKLGPKAAIKRLEHLRTFFDYCVNRDWMPKNPAEKLEAPEDKVTKKEPFTPAEMDYIYQACWSYTEKRECRVGDRAYALVLLLRYSGFRISDAVMFHESRWTGDGNEIVVYQKKVDNEQPVTTWLPDWVVRVIRRQLTRDGYYFLGGRGSKESESARKLWTKQIGKVFAKARVIAAKNGEKIFVQAKPHLHRFRHTFAAELLQRGVDIQDVAELLGHSNWKTTHKYYARWSKARKDRLRSVAQCAWEEETREHNPRLVKKTEERREHNPHLVKKTG
jgi:site-specific recombinase XerD